MEYTRYWLSIPVADTVGLEVTEVAHDYQPQIQKFLEKEIHCLNSFDTWHGNYIPAYVLYMHVTHKTHIHTHLGTKNVAKMLKKVCVGTVAQRGKTWFPELADKSMLCSYYAIALFVTYPGKSTKTHLYWCMKNAGGDPEVLRARVLNISKHYQVLCLHNILHNILT